LHGLGPKRKTAEAEIGMTKGGKLIKKK
jgi:hypothetical protein